MEQAKEFFGLFLLSAFMLIFPGMVSLCDCQVPRITRALAISSVSIFSGQVQSIEEKSVLFNNQTALRTTYLVQPSQRWITIGSQAADYHLYQLPRLHSADACSETQGNYLFVVVGPAHEPPYAWNCYEQPFTLLNR